MTDMSDGTGGLDGGEAIVSAFEAIGSDYIFSSPGSEWAPVWEALARRHRDGVSCPGYLDLTHETVAVGMATGYGLVTGRTQGVLLHAGPGLLQGSMAVHGALLSGVSMVVASSESITYGDTSGPDPGGQWYRNLSVLGGPHTWAAPWTKWATHSMHVDTLHPMITRAAEISQRAPAGPVYLNVALEALLDPWVRPPAQGAVAPAGSTVSAQADIDRVAAVVAQARRPLIVTESAGREDGGMDALVAFAEAFSIPVIEPNSAVCASFPRDHALHAGDNLQAYVDEADLILLIDCRAPFYPPSRTPADATVIVIDEVPQRPHVVYQVLNASHYLEGEVSSSLLALAAAAPEVADEAATARATWAAQLGRTESEGRDAAELKAAAGQGIDPVALVVALRELYADEDPIFVDETITHSSAVRRHLRRSTPDSYFYVQGGLGQGLAVGLGARLAVGEERPVVIPIGDGAFQYNPVIQSLDASRQLGLAVLIVVFNNQRYKSMQLNHLRFYPQGAAVETGEFLGVDLSGQPELSEFAAPFGLYGEAVTSADELVPALTRARDKVRSGVSAIVNVTVTR